MPAASGRTEPAAHHRERIQRSWDRTLVAAYKGKRNIKVASAVKAAASRLDAHHGSSSGLMATAGKDAAKFSDWCCATCKTSGGKPYRNFGFRDSCNQCGCKPPKGSRMHKHGNGDPRVRRPKQAPRGGEGGSSTANDIAQAVSKAMQPILEQLGMPLPASAMLAAKAPPGNGSGVAAAEVEVMEVEEDQRKVSLRKEWEMAVARVEHWRATPKMLQESNHAEKVAQLEALAKVSEDLYRAHGTTERQRSAYLLREDQRAAKASEAAAQVAKDKYVQVQRLSEELAKAQTAASAADAEVAKALAAAAAASDARKAHAAQQASGATAATEMHAPPQPPIGCVSIAYAEEKWAEREAAVAMQIAQLQALVATQTEGAAAIEISSSEAGDLASVEQLEDDEAWSKVERGKRKAVLGREREALASRVRSSLAKVSSVASPFKKSHA